MRGGGLCVVALDTELLGLHWHEGVAWLAAVLEEAGRAALRIAPLDVLLDAAEPVPAPDLPVTSWGTPRDLATWSGPAAGGLAWRQRSAELRAVAAMPDVSDRALRELLALQSSDWAFLVARATAGTYPARARGGARGRVRGGAARRPARTLPSCATWRRISRATRSRRPEAAFRPRAPYALPLAVANQPSPRRHRRRGSGGPKGARSSMGRIAALSAA